MKRNLVSMAGVMLMQATGVPVAQADAGFERFVASGYVYCDAVILGAYWNEAADEAKVLMGVKLGQRNGNALVRAALEEARNDGNRCEFHETPFGYADAEALAAYWAVSVEDAKASLAEKVSTGYLSLANDVVATAHASQADTHSAQNASDEEANFARFAQSSYEYCDAVMLGAYWGESAYEAKLTIGRKIGFGNDNILAANREEAREQGQRCAFIDTGYNYEDAEAVAALWDIGIDEAKAALAEKVSMGYRELADQVIAQAAGG